MSKRADRLSAWHRPKRVARVYSHLIDLWVGLFISRPSLLDGWCLTAGAGGDFPDFNMDAALRCEVRNGLGLVRREPGLGPAGRTASPSQPSEQGKIGAASWPRRVTSDQ